MKYRTINFFLITVFILFGFYLKPSTTHGLELCSKLAPPTIGIEINGNTYYSDASITVMPGTQLTFTVYVNAEPSSTNTVSYPGGGHIYYAPSAMGRTYTTSSINNFGQISAWAAHNCDSDVIESPISPPEYSVTISINVASCSINSFTADNTSPVNNTGTTLRFVLNGVFPWNIDLLQGNIVPSPNSGNSSSGTSWTGNLPTPHIYRLSCGNSTRDLVVTPLETCQDSAANNFGAPLPCTYNTGVCQDPSANNFGGNLPCTYNTNNNVCQDSTAMNNGGPLPCVYACKDPTAQNFNAPLPCTYAPIPVVCTENASVTVIQQLPATMTPGQTASFIVRSTNTGNTRWYHGSVYRLEKRSGSLSINPTYGHLPGVLPGDYAQWTFNVTAPATLGPHSVGMQMLHTIYDGGDYIKPDGTTCPGPAVDTYFGNVGSVNTVVVAANTPPSTPTITGTNVGYTNTNYPYSFVSTDDQNDRIRYGVDWNMDSVADEWFPAGNMYVDSGVIQNKDRSWPTPGLKFFQVLAQDFHGLNSPWGWYIVNINSPNVVTNGVCGTRNTTYPAGTPSYPSGSTYCASGTPTASPAFPAPGTSVSWSCNGISGGTNSGQCVARLELVSAACGTRNTTYPAGTSSYPSGSTYCTAGTPSANPPFPITGGPVTWFCTDSSGTTSSGQCSARLIINGVCGTRNTTYPAGTPSYPSGSTYCASGTPTASPAFPAPGTSVSWYCVGSNTGVNSGQCTASLAVPTFSVTAISTTGGRVESNDGKIICGNNCTENYIQNSTVVLQAIPNSSYWRFVGWAGDCSGNNLVCTLNVDGPKTITPIFAPREFKYEEF